jgi:hypothetical protein
VGLEINFDIGRIAFGWGNPFYAYKVVLLNNVFCFKVSSVLKVLLKQFFMHLLSKSFFFRHNNLNDWCNFRFLCRFGELVLSHQLGSVFRLRSSLNCMINNIGTSVRIRCYRDIFFLTCILRLQFLSLLFFFVYRCFISLLIRKHERLGLFGGKHVRFVLKIQITYECVEK